ncbi:hypothetical protein [Jeotgalibacillus campisalis]|uniref:Uncharacterized protein n=1 Tax=Jeotgalibacillus campisalis TaxID=220754 RepID=A0A0C2VZ04_9BACL|nr:hypothetical protein [Jeotgalibacillus campisalis]KIL49183.1 hypothetical protein KR50_12180 [Jeotgalibacillus campisalis]
MIQEKTIPYDKSTLLIQSGFLSETSAVIAIERVEKEGEIQLVFSSSSPGEITYTQFTKPMILSQFNPDGRSDVDYQAGTDAILLKVPENIEILKEDDDFILYLE